MGYVLRDGTLPGVAIYTRCEDELLCRAELIRMLDDLAAPYALGQAVFGYYDVDPSFTIAEFKRAYRGRSDNYRKLMAARKHIIENGWPYPWHDLPKDFE